MLPRKATIYLHLAKGRYAPDLRVVKVAQTALAQPETGVVVVKVNVSVPGDFFDRVMPVVDIEIDDATSEKLVAAAVDAPDQPPAEPERPEPEPPLVCRDHHAVQHRDGKEPWCNSCGRTAFGQHPVSRFPAIDADPDVE